MLKASRSRGAVSRLSNAPAYIAAAAALAGAPCHDAAAKDAAAALLGVKPGDEELLLVPEHPEVESVLEDALLDATERMVRGKGEGGLRGEGRATLGLREEGRVTLGWRGEGRVTLEWRGEGRAPLGLELEKEEEGSASIVVETEGGICSNCIEVDLGGFEIKMAEMQLWGQVCKVSGSSLHRWKLLAQ
jgi:hypothetical protein